jgi:hypothetical protein
MGLVEQRQVHFGKVDQLELEPGMLFGLRPGTTWQPQGPAAVRAC